MTAPTVSQLAEVLRLRVQLAELHRLVAAHLAADPGPTVTVDLARRWAAEAYDLGHTAGVDAGRLQVITEMKAAQHEVHNLLRDSAPVWAMHAEALRRPA
jgi:hypothetical protein